MNYILYKNSIYKHIMKNSLAKISFAEAKRFLNDFRYKKRNTWSDEDRRFFKICNFVVLSRKRINKIFDAFSAFEKLSNKSHYSYNANDINLVKGIILENLEDKLKSFNKDLSVFKDTDIEKINSYLDSLKSENLRLENENKRLQFIIENFVTEKKLFEVQDIKDILTGKNSVKPKNESTLRRRGANFSKANIKKFLKLWNEGKTSIEIISEFSGSLKNK